jgi:hypothetical protein
VTVFAADSHQEKEIAQLNQSALNGSLHFSMLRVSFQITVADLVQQFAQPHSLLCLTG